MISYGGSGRLLPTAAFFALMGVISILGTAQAATADRVFYNNSHFVIHDHGTTVHKVTAGRIPGNAPANLRVHTVATFSSGNSGDLEFILVAPDGTRWILQKPDHRDHGSTIDRTWTVDASSVLANGTWQLQVIDDDPASGDAGMLTYTDLTFPSSSASSAAPPQVPTAAGKTFYNDSHFPIPDHGSNRHRVTVKHIDGNAPSNLQVHVKITHNRSGDLRIVLIGPDGSQALLQKPDYKNGGNIDKIWTIDASKVPADGTWTLQVTDDDPWSGDAGMLTYTGLTFPSSSSAPKPLPPSAPTPPPPSAPTPPPPSAPTPPPPAGKQNFGIVYVRVPRGTQPIIISSVDNRLHGNNLGDLVGKKLDPSYMAMLPEVAAIRSGFNAPGQLVWLHPDGTQTIIYDCLAQHPDQKPGPSVGPNDPVTEDDTCVPMDPAVSYDGTKVAFAVYHGTWLKQRNILTQPGQSSGEVGQLANPTWADIYIYDFKTGQLTAWDHKVGRWDMSPVWLPDGRIMFASTRSNMRQLFFRSISGVNGLVQQLWIANADGSGAHNVDSHDEQDVLHPFVHSSGRVVYSSHQFNEVRGAHETEPNLWWLVSINSAGGDFTGHLHTHQYKDPVTLTAPHFLGERSNGDLCTDMYYRGASFGAGEIFCWPTNTSRSPLGHEGEYPFYFPVGFYTAISGDMGDDGAAKATASDSGLYTGLPDIHVRDPAGIPDNQLMFAGDLSNKAQCHYYGSGQYAVPIMVNLTARGGTCDFGIYATTTLEDAPEVGYNPRYPARLPKLADGSPKLIVNSPQWMEFMPKPVLPYSAIYGIAKPADAPLETPANQGTGDNIPNGHAIFASTNTFKANLHASWQGPGNSDWCRMQGCAMQAFVQPQVGKGYDTISDIAYIRFWKAIPNDRSYKSDASHDDDFYDNWGQKLELIGDVPVQPDGSFKALLPADTPFLMAGVDANGNSIARHQHLMSLRPGEEQICSGCHLHNTTDTENADHAFNATDAAKYAAVTPVIPKGLPSGVLEWNRDVYPILQKDCASCHDGKGSDPQPDFAAHSMPLFEQLLHSDRSSEGGLSIAGKAVLPPWDTKYVNIYFARMSLLYWKAAGQRLDGWQDSMWNNDWDFGPAHPAHMSAQDLKVLSLWLESGAYCDPNANPDGASSANGGGCSRPGAKY